MKLGLTLRLSVYDDEDRQVAKFHYAEDAASFVAGRDGYSVRRCSRKLFTEGQEFFSAAESFDRAAALIYSRLENT